MRDKEKAKHAGFSMWLATRQTPPPVEFLSIRFRFYHQNYILVSVFTLSNTRGYLLSGPYYFILDFLFDL
jgi:hypothetical protein